MKFQIVNGLKVPTFFYGTAWKQDQTARLTEMALNTGFRAIDTANQRKHYFEEGVGAGLTNFLTASKTKRDDIFIQTKFTYARGQDHRKPYDETAPYAKQVKQSFESSLQHLGVAHIDSYILHGPFTGYGISREDQEVWRAIESLQTSGKVKLIGVSNVSADQLKDLYDFATVKPSFAQIRTFAANAWESDTREFCNKHSIIFQGFSLLTANQRELQSDLIYNLAEKYQREISQIVFRFAKQLGVIPLTGTSDLNHMKIDLETDDFELTKAEIAQIENITR
jgi:diketogulonate reductase-like aldo/keto reductase